MTDRQTDRQTIICFQGLRALAFLGIFLSHTGVSALEFGGPWGVSTFFILSGFLMTLNYRNRQIEGNNPLKKGLILSWNKIGKLYQLHILTMITALPFGIKAICLKPLVLLSKILCNVFLVQSWMPRSSYYYSLNAVAWYLSVSAFLYFAFPWILKQVKKQQTSVSIILTIILIAGSQLLLDFLSSKTINNAFGSDGFTKWFVYVFPLSRCLEFSIGCNAAWLFIKRKHKVTTRCVNCLSGTVLIGVVTACFAFARYFPTDHAIERQDIWWTYTCIFTPVNTGLIIALAYQKGFLSLMLSNKWVVGLGNISSYAFLIHQLVIRYVRFAMNFFDFGKAYNNCILIVISFVATLLLSMLWKALVVEKRLIGKAMI